MDAHQLSLRRRGIGGSDIAAICGYSTWSNPMDVYMSKTGMLKDTPALTHQSVGHFLEPAILKIFEHETGLKTKPVPYPGIYVSPRDSWHIMSPDSFLEEEDAGVEVKNVGIENAHLWGNGEEDIPVEYFFQVHWYIAGFNVPHWYVVALIGGNQPRIYKIYRNDKLEQELLALGGRFWHEHVVPQVPPEIDGSAAATSFLTQRYTQPDDALLTVTDPNIHALVSTLQRSGETIRETEKVQEEMKNKLRDLIGNHYGLEGTLGEKSYRVLWSKARDTFIVDYDRLVRDLLDKEELAPYRPSPELIAQHSSVLINTEAVTKSLALPDGFLTPYTTVRTGTRVFRAYFDVKPKKKKGQPRGTNRNTDGTN